jgi:hypothetical protein
MAIFQPPDDPSYLAWLDANPNGYVINTERGGRQYVMLHRATCSYMRRFPPFVGPSYIKICSTSLDQIEKWALQRSGRDATRCNAQGSNCWH